MFLLRSTLFGVAIKLFQIVFINCGFPDWRLPYFPVYYPEAGKGFTLDVGFPGKFSWLKDGTPLVLETCEGYEDLNCTQPIVLFKKNGTIFPSLIFKNISHEDSGKYVLKISGHNGRVASFKIIVKDKPIVVSDCKDMTVKEGGSITCVCKTTDGYPSAYVTWRRSKPYQGNLGLKNSTGVLRLENISKNQSGTYSCFANSQDFANTTSFNLKVVSENYVHSDNSVEIAYFEVFQRITGEHCKLTIICKARGIPEPSYIITHNGTIAEYENVFTLDTKKNNSQGHYECFARNKHGSDRRLLFLNKNFLVKACNENEYVNYNKEMDWKFRIIIVGASSFVVGILLLCIFMCCCKKRRTKKDLNETGGGKYDDVLRKHVNDSSGPVEKTAERSNEDSYEDYDGEYDDVRPRLPPKGLGTTEQIINMRLRHTLASPGIEVERDSAGYDIPELRNCNEHEYFYDNNYTKFVAPREKDDKRYQL